MADSAIGGFSTDASRRAARRTTLGFDAEGGPVRYLLRATDSPSLMSAMNRR